MQQRQGSATGAKVASVSAEAPVYSAPPPPAKPMPVRSTLQEKIAFLRGFFAHPQQVGSVIPSSQLLEKRLVRCADLAAAGCLVELGPGTGGTTRAMLKALPAGAQLLAIELNAEFAERLKATLPDPRLKVVHGSAEHIGRYLEELQLPAPDAVVSGIPFSTMPTEVADRIAAEIARVLAADGRFVAYQVRAAVADYATPYLGSPHKEWELINIPPVRVFTWSQRNVTRRRPQHL